MDFQEKKYIASFEKVVMKSIIPKQNSALENNSLYLLLNNNKIKLHCLKGNCEKETLEQRFRKKRTPQKKEVLKLGILKCREYRKKKQKEQVKQRRPKTDNKGKKDMEKAS